MRIRNPIKPVRVESRRYWPHLALIAALWGWAMTADYYDQLQAAEQEATRMTLQLADCLNGSWRGKTPSGAQIGCYRAEVVEAKERSRK